MLTVRGYFLNLFSQTFPQTLLDEHYPLRVYMYLKILRNSLISLKNTTTTRFSQCLNLDCVITELKINEANIWRCISTLSMTLLLVGKKAICTIFIDVLHIIKVDLCTIIDETLQIIILHIQHVQNRILSMHASSL